MLITERPNTSGIHNQRRLGKWLADPTHRKRPQNVAMADDHNVARDARLLRLADDRAVVFLTDLGDQVVDARDDVLGALAAGTPVAPDVPGAETLRFAERADLGGCDALVVAVVPFGDAGCDCHGGGRVVW